MDNNQTIIIAIFRDQEQPSQKLEKIKKHTYNSLDRVDLQVVALNKSILTIQYISLNNKMKRKN